MTRDSTASSCPRCGSDLPKGANFCVGCGHDLRDGDGEFQFKPPDPLIGQTVADRYHILELVGRGGMGVVYKVEHVRMGKLMAMKLLHGELARDREVVKRFKREATAVSRLSHPNTVQVFDFGRSDGLMYLIMEFIEGRELARLVRQRGPISFERCAAIVAQVCSSLTEAHELGIIHRDLKPENVLLRKTRDDQELVKVLDFGLAKLRETEERAETTCQGVLVGTPHYMSPEQIRGDEIDPRSDIYSLGALIYKVLCGEPPFPASTPVAVLTKHLSEPPPSICEKFPELEIPEAADDIIQRCLDKEASNRYQTVGEIREALLNYLAREGSSSLLPSDSSIMPAVSPRREKKPSRPAEDVDETPKTPTGAMRIGNRLIEIGSRGEFERFERVLRARRVFSWIAASAAVLALLCIGIWQAMVYLDVEAALSLHHRLFEPSDRQEREPNDEPAQAERMWTGITIQGNVGKRVSLTESDRDWYLVRNEGGQPRVLNAKLAPIPRMDLVLEAIVFDSSGPRTLAESNEGGPGEGESLQGISIEDEKVYLLVREEWMLGRPPTENVSDFYSLSAELEEVGGGDEAGAERAQLRSSKAADSATR